MSEKRYIDADALYEMARTNPNYKDFCRSQADLTSLRELLDEYPAADVEPVVRCRDCKHGTAKCQNSIYCEMLHFYHREDFYCFYGAHMERSGSGE